MNNGFSRLRDCGEKRIGSALDFKAIRETGRRILFHRETHLGRSRQPAIQ
jgi:hypothetical protein